MDRALPRLPKSASSSALSSLDRRRDRRGSNPPAAMLGDWARRPLGPPPAASAGLSGRRPSEPGVSLATADGVFGQRPPKPHRGLGLHLTSHLLIRSVFPARPALNLSSTGAVSS